MLEERRICQAWIDRLFNLRIGLKITKTAHA